MQKGQDLAKTSILVVDDDPDVRVVMAEFLEDFGFCVVQAAGGTEALRLLGSHPQLDLIITDIRMPDMFGLELAELAAQQRSGLKIILTSGYFLPQQVQLRFLRKPFRMRELEAAVRAELAA